MKNLLIATLLILQPCMAFAQNCCMTDSSVREIQFPLTEKDTQPVLYYFNNEWIALPHGIDIPTDSIQKMEVKDDQYGNRAVFLTVSSNCCRTEIGSTEGFLNLDPRCEFPGGNGKFKEWLDANIQIPEGYKGSERVVVQFDVQPDGTVTNQRILRPSKNDAANEEALRLANALPKFRVQYYTPKKACIRMNLPIVFKEPNTVWIKGSDRDTSFNNAFPAIEKDIKSFYDNFVFLNRQNPDFRITDVCTPAFLKRLSDANDLDNTGYAVWLLRSGFQDGQDTPSEVLSVEPGNDSTVIVHWNDMGIEGSTTLTLIEHNGKWMIDNATVPAGYNPL